MALREIYSCGLKAILLTDHKELLSKKYYKGNNKITELRTILQRESQNS